MAAAPESSPAMTMKYDKPQELLSASGIFSFSIYMKSGGFNETTLKQDNVLYSPEFSKYSNLIYFVGIISYLEMITKEHWAGWKVVIHTDDLTISGNPEGFKILKEKGAIIGTTTLKEEYNEIRPIFRINRFFPLFIKKLTCPVFIRDADTIFETEIGQEVLKRNSPLSIYDSILPEFINGLDRWESQYYKQVIGKKDTVVFSYDDEYSFSLQAENLISKDSLKWLGKTNFKNVNKTPWMFPKARFLAGVVSKIGQSLPISLWNPGLNDFIKYYLENIEKKHFPLIPRPPNPPNPPKIKLMWIDEAYLTNVIYKWCKENNRASFFKMNYIGRELKILDFGSKYLQEKYPNALIPTKNKQIRFNNTKIHNIQNKELARITFPQYYNRNSSREEEQFWRKEFVRLALKRPDLLLTNNAFINPLELTPETKPPSVPNYVFGGTKKRRTNKRKMRKNKIKTRKNTL